MRIGLKTNLTEVVQGLMHKLGCITNGDCYDTIMRTVATTELGMMKTRIHERGLAADGSAIGQYSTTPMYVGVKANPGKSFGRPVGKTGKSKFKSTGLDHTSRYFITGYKGFKDAIGRNELGTVNLSLSGQLNSQLTVIATSGGYGIGWPDDEKGKRAAVLEKKYRKKIWAPTDEESAIINKTATKLLKDAFSTTAN